MTADPGPANVLDARLRDLLPRVLASVTKRCGDFAAAEDAVQEALLDAAESWPRTGVPENAAGWLFAVALRRLADAGDADRARRRREHSVALDRADVAMPIDCGATEHIDEFGDETLALLFACCHPSLPSGSAIPLMLRVLCGMSTAAIARALLLNEATLAQRLGRAKSSIASSGVPLALPPASERERRLHSVLNTVYLLANEGHLGSADDESSRVAFAAEAVRLARLLARLLPGHPEVEGLLALLLLTESRRAARRGPDGELVPLEDQDRSRWDRALIAEGTGLATAAISRGRVGTYQLQAAIAALHAEAPDLAGTDWPQILALYTLLLQMTGSPVVALNRAVALAMVQGPRAGLAEVERIAGDPRLAASHRVDAVRAHLLQRAGDPQAAREAYVRAAARAVDPLERAFLLRRAAQA